MFKQKIALQLEALDSALSLLFNEDVKTTILEYFELRQKVSREKKEPFGQREIEQILMELLGSGGNLVVLEFRKQLEK